MGEFTAEMSIVWLASCTVKSTNSLDSSDFPSHSHSISVQQILNVPCTRLRHLSKHIIILTNLGRFCFCFPWLKQILIAVLSSYIFQVQGVMGALGTPTWLNQEISHLWCFDFSFVSITNGAIRLQSFRLLYWPHVEWTLSQEERTEISVSWLWYLKMLRGS